MTHQGLSLCPNCCVPIVYNSPDCPDHRLPQADGSAEPMRSPVGPRNSEKRQRGDHQEFRELADRICTEVVKIIGITSQEIWRRTPENDRALSGVRALLCYLLCNTKLSGGGSVAFGDISSYLGQESTTVKHHADRGAALLTAEDPWFTERYHRIVRKLDEQ